MTPDSPNRHPKRSAGSLADECLDTIRSAVGEIRDRSIESLVSGREVEELLDACATIEDFRRSAVNLYERVRATLCLRWIYRFRLAESPRIRAAGIVPASAYRDFLAGNHEDAVRDLRAHIDRSGADGAALSALATVYGRLGFQTLCDQVRASVRASEGNRWMFSSTVLTAPPDESVPLRAHAGLRSGDRVLIERTPVRVDLSHSGWSDIFFLGMDAPREARVVNASVDLRVRGSGGSLGPPVEVRVRGIDRPVVRLRSLDLAATTTVESIRELFDFGRDHLGLLKAGVVASGVVPASLETSSIALGSWLETILGAGRGIEVETHVHGIPKGSRLAVSTTLLASIIAALMRVTGQTRSLSGPLEESERRLVASRAILGEWLGGSGGGWQDSGGLWPGVKVIEGQVARPGDAEFGVSRGRLLPAHRTLVSGDGLHPEFGDRLAESLILVHGGMAQDVGPILEMVTDRYLLRSSREWAARRELRVLFDRILAAMADGNIATLARCTTRNFDGPLREILPWVTNAFTERVRERVGRRFGTASLGFLMLGGMSGGGMGFFVAPGDRDRRADLVLETMSETKRELEAGLPFAMDPVVYDFEINSVGSSAVFEPVEDSAAARPTGAESRPVDTAQKDTTAKDTAPEDMTAKDTAPEDMTAANTTPEEASPLLLRREEWGFDEVLHERLRARLLRGEIGLACNRLSSEARIEDIEDASLARSDDLDRFRARGESALADGTVAVVTLAGGLGSRWSSGAGVVKAVHPVAVIRGRHMSFLEAQLGKTAREARRRGVRIPHVVTTSFLTHEAIAAHVEGMAASIDGRATSIDSMARLDSSGESLAAVVLSPGRSVGQRLIPRTADLEYFWREMPHETLDEPKQKLRDSIRAAWMDWARSEGEGADYVRNLPEQCLHPPGHWYEVANLLRNGRLAAMLDAQPALRTLAIHNVDTLGFSLDPSLLGFHLASERPLTFEVVPRRFADRGGGLATVEGRPRIVEELAQPDPEDDLRLRYYNSMTTWIDVDRLLGIFALERSDLAGPRDRIDTAVRDVAERLPTYLTLKEVKRRFGRGHEDVFPVAQFEKLWSDMTGLADVDCGFAAVSRMRGQQLKGPEQLDEWARDGSLAFVESLLG